jgi:hypothetical protein
MGENYAHSTKLRSEITSVKPKSSACIYQPSNTEMCLILWLKYDSICRSYMVMGYLV